METITVEQVVNETIGILSNVRIPATLPVEVYQEIRTPIIQAISNLNACCDAWKRDAAIASQQAQEAGEPEITVEAIADEEAAENVD